MRLKTFVILFSLLFTSLLNAQTDIETLRKSYYKVDTDSIACYKLYKKVSTEKFSDNLSNGYKGAVICAMAGHSKKKEEKLKLFNEGKKLLEDAVKKDSSNVELRFLRLTIQSGSPKALGYNKKISTDKDFIIQHLDSVKNTTVKKHIIQYMVESLKLQLTEEQRKKLKASS